LYYYEFLIILRSFHWNTSGKPFDDLIRKLLTVLWGVALSMFVFVLPSRTTCRAGNEYLFGSQPFKGYFLPSHAFPRCNEGCSM